jgi:hypothetical protein
LCHEAGHSLYLGHSQYSQAVMYAYYTGRRTLHQDDINGISFLYPKSHTPTPTPTPTRTASPAPKGGGGCFIATAAFGSYMHKDVMVLRNFRDSILMKSTMGRNFVESYYRTSPPVADYIAARPALRAVTRCSLVPMIITIKYPVPTVVVFLLGIGIMLFVKRRGLQM